MSDNLKYQIFFKGTFYPVSEELYNFYNKSERQTRYIEKERKTGRIILKDDKVIFKKGLEDSIERIMVDRNIDFALIGTEIEESIEKKILIESALNNLKPKDRRIIKLLYLNDKTEAEVANIIGITQQGIHKRKIAILLKMHKYINS